MGRNVDAIRALERQAVARLKADLTSGDRSDATTLAASTGPA